MRILYKICGLVVGAVLLTTAVLTWIGYTTARREHVAGVDRQLTATAAALPEVIGADYLVRALAGDRLPSAEYDRMVHSLNDLADRSDVYFVYVFAERADRIVHLATSASPAEREAGDWPVLLQPYEEPPAEIRATFRDGRTRFAEYTDEFGSFRSIFVRSDGPAGVPYVVGVDVALRRIHSDLASLVVRYALTGVLVAALTGGLGVLLARRLTRPLNVLSAEVANWSHREFASDDAIRAHLLELSAHHGDEAGELAARFVDVQDRLQSYLKELTETTAAKQKIERDLDLAREIQRGLLPQEPLRLEGFDIAGWNRAADQTGGDYCDWMTLPDGRAVITLADVTGHGVGPALIVSVCRAYMRKEGATGERALTDVLARVNDLLFADIPEERFVTAAICVLDPATSTMSLLSAGQAPLLYYSAATDEVSTWDADDLPLAVVDGLRPEDVRRIEFRPGDVFVLTTDGFFEWPNEAGEQFGTARLAAAVRTHRGRDADSMIQALYDDVLRHAGGTAQGDDLTAVVIKKV